MALKLPKKGQYSVLISKLSKLVSFFGGWSGGWADDKDRISLCSLDGF